MEKNKNNNHVSSRMRELTGELKKIDEKYKEKVRELSEICQAYLDEKKNLHKMLFELESSLSEGTVIDP